MDLKTLAAKLNSKYPDRNWDQWCQALVWNAIYILCGYVADSQMTTYPTAAAARHASRIESTNAAAAPVGAIHYWRYPSAGHVGISLGRGQVLMTGTPGKVPDQLGKNYGVTSVGHYTRATGNPYLGWARRNGANETIIGKLDTGPAKSITVPSVEQWALIQTWLKRLGRYHGPADGVPGINTWKGIQRTVAARAGYTGPTDGVPGPNTYKAMQRYAAAGGGYTGPIDGVLGRNSWRGFIQRLTS